MGSRARWLARTFSVLCALAGVAALLLGMWLQAALLVGGLLAHEVLAHRWLPTMVLTGGIPSRRH